jgi:hypothetical protein
MATIATAMARFRGGGRVYQHDGKARILRLVLDELPQLIEGPGMVLRPLGFPHLGALPYPGQIFQGKGFTHGLCGGHQPFTDDVVDRAHMTLLVSRQPFQEPFGSLRAFGLERTPDLEGVGAERLYGVAFVDGALRIHGDTSAAQIDTEDAHGSVTSRSRGFDLDMQEERPIAAFDQGRAGGLLTLEAAVLRLPKRHLEPFTA